MIRNSLRMLISRLDLGLRRRVPLIHQTESSECGLACLAMICGHYGKNVDMATLRREFNLSARGAALTALTGMATQLGLTTRPLTLDLNELKALRLPCMLHWEFNHYVVLVEAGRDSVLIHDPAQGRREVSMNEVSKFFTGIALEVWPDSTFTTGESANRFSFRTLAGSVHGLRKTLGKILCLSLVIETISLVVPVGTQLVMDHAIPAQDLGLLTLICCGLIFFILLRMLFSLFRGWTSLIMSASINVQWQSGLVSHLMYLPLGYFERRKLGDIQSRFGSLDELRSTFTTSIVGAIIDSMMVLGVLCMMILYGGWLTWVVIAFTGMYVLIRLLTYTYYRQLTEESLIKNARAGSYFMETLYGISTIKIQGMAELRIVRWLNLKVDAINTSIRVTKLDMLLGGVSGLVAAFDQVIILWLGASLVIANQMTIGMFVAFGAFRGQFTDRVGSLISFLLQMRMMSLHNERVADIALHPREPRKADLVAFPTAEPASLSVKSLTYSFDTHTQPVFHNLSMSIAAGESVAITGPSGSGKTTLIKVLCGLFLPDDGTVEINGVDILQLGINNYQKYIACVMQDDRLFSGSIRENICSFSENADEDWMLECARTSYLHEFIMQLPMRYETMIGELGEGLSGGQKQRLFIARALYKRPKILFMDEATSALDAESENQVNQAIKKLRITRIIIAHRESTILSAERVVTLSK
ncbi:peptidase domain-containing ABC transporter [Type-D symbiont of Plautia stali]|uniref:peptidase domain-containing ABC transporter n=1 Tax=Type-D symbiont of Plautia stali TaxID=1560356 RepID=UPI00073ED25D|nr:peptidase domain-containing ABC transporter [Type-D symbiont of Plautia stali]